MLTKFKDYYDLLGVEKDADKDQIKQAFMKKAMEWHPDKAKDDDDRQNREKVYCDIRQAYTILCNDETRKMYQDSQQNTFNDFKNQDRDLGYQQTNRFVKITEKGREFDAEDFSSVFNSTRGQQENEAIKKLTNNVKNDKVTDSDVMRLIEQRDLERKNLDSEMTQVFEKGPKFDSNTFNRVFDFMKSQHASTSLQEYNGEPQAMFSTGGLVEDDGMSGLEMSNGVNFMGQYDMGHLVNGAGFNPGSNFDLSQFQGDNQAYGHVASLTNEELNQRVLEAQADRERLLKMDKKDFSNEPSEIEKMYSGLFVPLQVEGLDAPVVEGEKSRSSEKIREKIAEKRANKV